MNHAVNAYLRRHDTFSSWFEHTGNGEFLRHTIVDPGDIEGDTEGTPLYLSDPAPARTNIFFPELLASNIMIRPAPGLMLLFPGYLQHGVEKHRGNRPRISIAFNARKEPFP